MPDIIKAIIAVAPYIVLCLLITKINLKKVNRGRQFLMPVIAIVYCLITVFLTTQLTQLFNQLVSVTGLNDAVSAIVSFLQPFVTSLISALYILGFYIIKLIALPILNKAWGSNKNEHLMSETSGALYEYDEFFSLWTLRDKFANARSYIKAFYYIVVVMTAVFLVWSQFDKSGVFFTATFYPYIGVLILGEVYFFMDGLTRQEINEDILGEDDSSRKVANLAMLKTVLRNLFGKRILFEGCGAPSRKIGGETYVLLEEMENSDNEKENILASYFKELKKSGVEVDINYVKSCLNMLNGHSVLFLNPFYRDFTLYAMLPILKTLMNYTNCLVVSGRDSSAEDICDWLKEGLVEITGTDCLYKADIIKEEAADFDIGVLKFSDLYNQKIHQRHQKFLEKVGFVILVEASKILGSGQLGLSLLVKECEHNNKNKITYCCFDRNCDGLVDALSHVLKTNITEVTATITPTATTSMMVWDADGPYMHHRIIPSVSRYLGVGTELNTVAIKHQINNVLWIGSEKFPVIDMKWISGQYFKQICNYANLPESQEYYKRVFRTTSNIWNVEKEKNLFLTVEDEFQNIFEMNRIYAPRALYQGFVNIISENYMMRDYMRYNSDVFIADPKAVPTVVPDYARTERNVILKLLMRMTGEPLSEEIVEEEFELCGISCKDVQHTLCELIKKHCSVKTADISVTFKEEEFADAITTHVVKLYGIEESSELYDYCNFLRNAYYIAEDETGHKNFIGAKLYGHIMQAMLPGQYLIYDGKYYEVETITPGNSVVLRRATEHIDTRYYYRQLRYVSLDSFVSSTEMGDVRKIGSVEICKGYAHINVKTTGYLRMTEYGNYAESKKVEVNGVPERDYINKEVLRISLENTTEEVRRTICFMLNELFKTVYPSMYHYIFAACKHNNEESPDDFRYALYDFSGENDENYIYIIEDSVVDLGLIVSCARNLNRFLFIIQDLMTWHNEKMEEVPLDNTEEISEAVIQQHIADIMAQYLAVCKKGKGKNKMPSDENGKGTDATEKKEDAKDSDSSASAEEKNDNKETETVSVKDSHEESNTDPDEKSDSDSNEDPSTEESKKVKKDNFIVAFFKKLFGRNKKKKDENSSNDGETDEVMPEEVSDEIVAEGVSDESVTATEETVDAGLNDDATAQSDSESETGETISEGESDEISGEAGSDSVGNATDTQYEPLQNAESDADDSTVPEGSKSGNEKNSDETVEDEKDLSDYDDSDKAGSVYDSLSSFIQKDDADDDSDAEDIAIKSSASLIDDTEVSISDEVSVVNEVQETTESVIENEIINDTSDSKKE